MPLEVYEGSVAEVGRAHREARARGRAVHRAAEDSYFVALQRHIGHSASAVHRAVGLNGLHREVHRLLVAGEEEVADGAALGYVARKKGADFTAP